MSGAPATTAARHSEPAEVWRPGQAGQVSLVDLLDRLLGTGVVLAGDVVISLSGVDLVQIKLNALITTVRADLARDRSREVTR